jgi:hypothetical protein
MLIEQRKASLKADYRYYPNDKEHDLGRCCCYPSTRE